MRQELELCASSRFRNSACTVLGWEMPDALGVLSCRMLHRFAVGTSTAIIAASDGEVVDKTRKEAQNKANRFVWARLAELSTYFEGGLPHLSSRLLERDGGPTRFRHHCRPCETLCLLGLSQLQSPHPRLLAIFQGDMSPISVALF